MQLILSCFELLAHFSILVKLRLREMMNIPKTIELQFLYSQLSADVIEWRTIADQVVSIEKGLEVKLDVSNTILPWGEISESFPQTHPEIAIE